MDQLRALLLPSDRRLFLRCHNKILLLIFLQSNRLLLSSHLELLILLPLTLLSIHRLLLLSLLKLMFQLLYYLLPALQLLQPCLLQLSFQLIYHLLPQQFLLLLAVALVDVETLVLVVVAVME